MAFLANIRQLILSHKRDGRNADPVPFRSYGADMQFLEIWARQPIQQLVAGSGVTLTPSSGLATDAKGNGPNPITISASGGGGGYASLTGPGTTVTPGALTQRGDFDILDGSGPYIADFQVRPESIQALAGEFSVGTLAAPFFLEVSSSTPEVNINDQPNGTRAIHVTPGKVQIGNTGFDLGFFGTHPGTTIQTITGSRGGNAALASLLTALAGYGLIIDSTTP